jgi:hypothetical protein
MSFDLVTRTFGVVACLYTVAYFITTMSVSALNAVTYSSGPMCSTSGCVSVARQERLLPGQGREGDAEPIWIAVSWLQNN